MRFSLKDVGADVRSSDRTYGPSWRGGRTVLWLDVRHIMTRWMYGQSVTRKLYFHQPSHSSWFLVIELSFNRNRIDDRYFLSIRSYRASRELHGGALRPGWVQTHMDALLLLFLHCISILYISNMHIFQLSWNIFWNYRELSFVKTCVY
jgi:hypothetical protein